MIARPDLFYRTALSKSQLASFNACQWAAWHGIHHRRDLIPAERITFGSALNAGLDLGAEYVRAGQDPDMGRMLEAAQEIVDRDGVPVDLAEITRALAAFFAEVAPHLDWTYAATQHHVSLDLPDWGKVDGHPDLIIGDAIWDYKTGKRPKPTARTVELGFYALLRELETGERPTQVGYLVWVRPKAHWQTITEPVTDEFLDWTRAVVNGFVRARDIDARINDGLADPVNVSMVGMPRYGCSGCQYLDLCPVAVRGGSSDVAA